MTDLPRPLTRAEHEALIEIITSENDDLLPLARAVNSRWLEDDECEALTNALLNVFLAHLQPDDEPDDRGATADALCGLIAMQRREFWAD